MEPRVSLITLGVAFFETRGTWLSVFPREELAKDAGVALEGAGFRGFALAHNVRSEAEVDATLALAVTAGATLVKPGQRVFWGGSSRTASSGKSPTTRISGSSEARNAPALCGRGENANR